MSNLNPQAFPLNSFNPKDTGMTLRDYFAGQALIGYIANPNGSWNPKSVSKDVYEIADAMLAEREKNTK